MSLGLLLIGHHPVGKMTDLARTAERAGFDTVWVADERFYREVYSTLAYIAARVERVRLGPCVTDPYARHPAMTAAAIATLDELSGGRAVLGFGAGVSGYSELGMKRPKPPRAMREGIEVIRALLRGEKIDYHGKVIQFHNGQLNFKAPRPAIPVYLASNGPLGQRLAGAIADGAIMAGCGLPESVKELRTNLELGAREANREPAAIDVVVRLNTCISDDGAVARNALRPAVARYLGDKSFNMAAGPTAHLALPEELTKPFANVTYGEGAAPFAPLIPHVTDRHVNAFTLAGTVDEVAQHVIELRKAGATSVMIMPFAAEGSPVERTVERFGTEVWPKVRRAMDN